MNSKLRALSLSGTSQYVLTVLDSNDRVLKTIEVALNEETSPETTIKEIANALDIEEVNVWKAMRDLLRAKYKHYPYTTNKEVTIYT